MSDSLNPMDYSLLGSSVCRIFEDRMLEWVAISISIRSSQPRDRTQVSCIVGRRFTIWATREATFFRGGGTKRSFVLHPLPQPHSACCSSPCLLPEGVSLGSFFVLSFSFEHLVRYVEKSLWLDELSRDVSGSQGFCILMRVDTQPLAI